MTLMTEQQQTIEEVSPQQRPNRWLLILLCLTLCVGIYFRFYQITENRFVFYDEGMWVLQNHDFVDFIARSAEQGWTTRIKLVDTAFHLSLRTGKALWAFLSMVRGFFVGAEGYYFTRVISAVLGSLTIAMAFIFTRRFYQSTGAAVLAASVLALLPSHIFYSRLALQEAYTAFFFMLGLYLYLYPRRMSVQTFVASLCFASVFFVNYRMIIIPCFVGFAEVYLSLVERRRPAFLKWTLHTVVFLLIVFGVGALDGGANTRVTFGWMFHQSQLAKGTFALINLLSYPYYVFTFEGLLFAAALLANGYLLFKRQWREAFPFLLVVAFMVVFSLPQEKGVRYLTSALPFMAMAVSWVIWRLGQHWRLDYRKYVLAGMVIAMLLWQMREGYHISRFDNAYQRPIVDLRSQDPEAKFVSTQSMVQRIYVDDKKDIVEFKYSIPYLAYLQAKGYRYLILDPQAYVSFTEDDLRFQPKLKGFLQFAINTLPPVQIYDHFDRRLLKRFVLEHNEHLGRSLHFLREGEQEGYGQLRVYDLQKTLAVLKVALTQWQRQ